RVMVNRLWQFHFGRGIVRTPSNFGFMGAAPTHPELLDWLAAELVEPTVDLGRSTTSDPTRRVTSPSSPSLASTTRFAKLQQGDDGDVTLRNSPGDPWSIVHGP